MIGVRESRIDKPKVMIYSLSGFTRGAKDLAEKNGVELRDVRSEWLKV
jgi:HJR/Mrr/RecB family endonuclease